jgi:uncharacterized protein
MEPTRGKERIEELDILRGWAIFGMLIVNVWVWQSFFLPSLPLQLTQVWTGTADQVALWLIDSFLSGRFWSLFSFLFGVGFALQMKRAEARGVRFAFFYRRRLFALFLIGSVQFLLGPSSILPNYAIVGFLLLPLRNRSSKLLLIVAIVCVMVPYIRGAGELRDIELRRADPQLAHELLQEEAQSEESRKVQRQHTVQVYREGTLRDVVVYNADRYAGRFFSSDFFIGLLGGELPLFLLGLYVGRRQVFENIPAHLPLIRRVMWWCLCLGSLNLVVNAVFLSLWTDPSFTISYIIEIATNVLLYIGGSALGFFYAAVLVLLAQREKWKQRLAPLAAVGRMALSNYLLHTLIILILFHNFKLYGKIGPAVGFAVAALVYAFLVALSVWWMRRFRFGPAEWLWRTITYGKSQPMYRTDVS